MEVMNVCLFPNDKPQSLEVAQALKEKLAKIAVNVTDQHPDIVISIGGDGTFLSAVQQFSNQLSTIRFVGVHTGHLGFYSDWLVSEIDTLVERIADDQGQTVNYPLMEGRVHYADGQVAQVLALNEMILNRITNSLSLDVYIDDLLFEKFRGDGLCISTPAGSSGYNKSLSGALIDPDFSALQMTEIASINNRVYRTLGSPIIISAGTKIRIVPELGNSTINYDSYQLPHSEYEEIIFEICKQPLKMANLKQISFWQRVKNSFIGEDC
ncbi:NAD kinase [Oenococcus sicerae]|uniref:NAD kinase n=2 Tax=Oenococcus sicerae TaxID=2203724 RepID=A0AAJ1VNJ8_9LACO|nr:NAD kinase [Oenococcus sicerae]QAS69055.1 NAD kinase [Oenococcus sicerae]